MDTRRAMAALAAAMPDDADICGIDFTPGTAPVVTIRTTTPGKVVGRMGRTAEQLRAALASAVGPHVRLSVAEQRARRAS